MSNPYETFEQRAFWRPAVGMRNPLEITELWRARYCISPEDKVVTAGSCFAQHFSKALLRSGFSWFDAEPGPAARSDAERKLLTTHGYGIFSFRTGNIYTAALLRQWVEWAVDPERQSPEVWQTNDRFYDPQRPAIEPGGFASAAEAIAMRRITLEAIRTALVKASVLVFTMGLTEGWENRETGAVYAMCPGTLAGSFDADQHVFVNYRHARILSDMTAVVAAARTLNPNLKFLLTVSPVPLTATASGEHVLAATTYSKSVLRAVAGDLCQDLAGVDYFPSYEIIASSPFRGMFYHPNQREVSPKGVEVVMSYFFAGNVSPAEAATRVPGADSSLPALAPSGGTDDVVCEDALLESFAQ